MDHTPHVFLLSLVLVGCGGTESPIAIDAGRPVRDAARETGDLVLDTSDGGDAADDAAPIPGCNGIELASASPSIMCHGTLTIQGKNFQPTPAVLLSCGNTVTPLTNVKLVSGTTLTATVPPPINPSAMCDVVVVNPDACEAVLPKAFMYWCEGPPGPQ